MPCLINSKKKFSPPSPIPFPWCSPQTGALPSPVGALTLPYQCSLASALPSLIDVTSPVLSPPSMVLPLPYQCSPFKKICFLPSRLPFP